MTFTHGYGASLSPVNQVTPEGLPVLFIKDIPPQSNVDLKVVQPEIYFGELANDHVFVNTGTKEFDYPEGCLLYTSPSPRDRQKSRMPSSA